MAGWGATTLLIGEYAPHEAATHAEFAIADGIIRFINEPMELTSVRMIEVLKLRGTNYLTGRHFFEIGPDGLSFYPRIRPPQLTVGAQAPTDRVPTGVEGLDELLGGGLPRASATLVEGGTGTGKTLLGLTFLMEGARRGEPGLLLTLEETPEQLRWVASGVGWDLATLEAQGLLSLIYTSPVELSPDRFLHEARRHVETLGVRRVVLDSLTALFVGVPSERRYKELVYSLTKHLRRLGVTLLTTMEVAELLGAAQITGRGISSITDNAILLRYVEMGGHLERAICVIKARGVKHQLELRRLVIDSDGVHFGPPFTDLRGVLTGMPVPVDNAPGPI
jgi:circadian clock protein KaiC